MIIVENYNNCAQKYGKGLTDEMVESGISPEYLLSACRFHIENQIPIEILVSLFKEWNTYVVKNNNVMDVNKISYEQFRQYISRAKSQNCLPNTIVDTLDGSLGRLYSVKDARNIPVVSEWCIKARGEFEKYLFNGDELYAIYLPKQPSPFTFNIAIVHQNGKITYWNSANKKQENFNGNNLYDEFESKLPTRIIEFLNSRSIKQKKINNAKQQKSNQQNKLGDSLIPRYNIIKEYNNQNNCNRNMRNKKVVRLTESQLHNIIAESVSQILEAWDYDKLKQAKKQHPDLMSKIDPRTYASRTRGVNAQGRTRNDDSIDMYNQARYKWNDEYGFNDGRVNNSGDYEEDALGMYGNHGGGFKIDRQLGKIRNGKKISNGESSFYDPEMNKTYDLKDKTSHDGVGIPSISSKGLKVAREMQNGNGKYNSNQGWQ